MRTELLSQADAALAHQVQNQPRIVGIERGIDARLNQVCRLIGGYQVIQIGLPHGMRFVIPVIDGMGSRR